MKKEIILIPLVILLTIAGSFLRERISPEKVKRVEIEKSMSLDDISKSYGIPIEKLTEELNSGDIDHTVSLNKLEGLILFQQEMSNKDIKKKIKFISWLIFLAFAFVITFRKRVNRKIQVVFYSISVLIFGVLLGPKPSPFKGFTTVLEYLQNYNMLYKPGIILLIIFLIIGLIFNKYLCAWGCPFGALQDLIHRLFRANKRKKIVIPFVISNTIRIALFLTIIIITLLTSINIVGIVDTFRIFTPLSLGIGSGILAVITLLASLYVYRPFCYFICPFGLLSWSLEKFSIFKIRVNRKRCINCKSCSKACPSNTMESILKKDSIMSDCFSCGSCIESCSEEAVQFCSKIK